MKDHEDLVPFHRSHGLVRDPDVAFRNHILIRGYYRGLNNQNRVLEVIIIIIIIRIIVILAIKNPKRILLEIIPIPMTLFFVGGRLLFVRQPLKSKTGKGYHSATKSQSSLVPGMKAGFT